MGHTPEGIARLIDARTTWTPYEDALLAQLWGEGKSTSKIAESFPGKSRNAVIGRVHRLRRNGKDFPERPAGRFGSREPRKPRPRLRVVRVPKEPFLPPKPIPPIIDTLEGSATFDERTGCKWPVTQDSPYRFCNREIGEGPYCAGHAARAYQPSSREMKRGKHEVPFG